MVPVGAAVLLLALAGSVGRTGNVAGPGTRAAASALAALPATMLWAWERPEDLRWLPPEAGVAYVAATVELVGGEARLRPRGFPLLVRADTAVLPVIHIDASMREPPLLNAAQHAAIVAQMLAAARRSGPQVVQLDFEVRASQRPFLLALVADLRRRLPSGVALSVTALASWCAGDYWIDALAADEIVPMAFRMARDDGAIRTLLAAQGGFTRPRCRAALGVATDEARVDAHGARRYIFSPRAWDQAAWRHVQPP
jgi:hypothetical protein